MVSICILFTGFRCLLLVDQQQDLLLRPNQILPDARLELDYNEDLQCACRTVFFYEGKIISDQEFWSLTTDKKIFTVNEVLTRAFVHQVDLGTHLQGRNIGDRWRFLGCLPAHCFPKGQKKPQEPKANKGPKSTNGKQISFQRNSRFSWCVNTRKGKSPKKFIRMYGFRLAQM